MQLVYEDISIICTGCGKDISFVPALVSTLRTFATTEIVQWRNPTENPKYILSKHGTSIERDTRDYWDDGIHSIHPLEHITSYFQIKLVKSGRIFIGVAKSNTPKDDDDIVSSYTTMCMYNSSGNKYDHLTVKRMKKFSNPSAGDVIGVVVDMKLDQVRFYINGELMAVGISKPSQFQPLYAVLWLHDRGCAIESGNFIPYHSLTD